jgi:serine/threonine-protein kinase
MFERTKSDVERPSGEWLGAWQPVEPLAAGGSLVLWRVTGADGGAALLRLYPRFQRQDTWRRFKTAAAQRSRLDDHQRLVTVTEVGAYGRPHVLLEDPVGEPLATRIEREPLSPAIALRVFDDVVAGLNALAHAGMPRVDLTPADVFVVGDRGLLLADTGMLVEVLRGRCLNPDHAAPQRVRTIEAGMDFGVRRTLGLLSPWHAPRPTASTTTYSVASALRAALTDPIGINGDGPAELDPAIRRVLDRGLARSRWRRYRTPARLVAAFRAAVEAEAQPEAPVVVPAAPKPSAAKPSRATASAVVEPPGRRIGARAAAAIVAACVVAAGVAGALIGMATTAPDPPARVALAADGLSVSAPAGWATADAATAPVDTGADALVASSAADPGAGLAITRSADPLLASTRGVEPDPVELGDGRGAWRYSDVRIGGSVADVYRLETTAGTIAAACFAPAAAGNPPLAACGRIVTSLQARGAQPLPLGGTPAARARLASVLTTLGRRRAEIRRALDGAGRPRQQAADADRIASSYARAAGAAGAGSAVGPPGARDRLAAELTSVGRAYAALADAARANDVDAYFAAARQVADREVALRGAIAQLTPVSAAD